jgi:hypothetical protein
MSQSGEPLYAKINRDLKTKRTRSICGTEASDLLLMTTTSATLSNLSTHDSGYKQNYYQNQAETKQIQNEAEYVTAVNNSSLQVNGSASDGPKTSSGIDNYNKNQNQWI